MYLSIKLSTHLYLYIFNINNIFLYMCVYLTFNLISNVSKYKKFLRITCSFNTRSETIRKFFRILLLHNKKLKNMWEKELSRLWLMQYRNILYQSLWCLKFNVGAHNSNSQVVYLLKCKICGEALRTLAKFRAKFNNYKSPDSSSRKKQKGSQQCFHEHYG